MVNPLSISSDGYLAQVSKKVLVIAVAGYLNFAATPIPPVPPSAVSVADGRGAQRYERPSDRQVIDNRILAEDEEVLIILKAFMEII
jgi:hypothetical protein